MTTRAVENILQSAERLFMKFGLKSVTMDDLSKHLGISKKTLYQFIRNKEGLIHRIVQVKIRMQQRMAKEASKNSQDAMEEMMLVGRYIVEELRGLPDQLIYDLRKYYRDTFQIIEDHHQDFIFSMIKRNIERGIKEGIYRENLDPEVIARLYVGKNVIIVDTDAFPVDKFHREELFRQHFTYHIRGIASKKGIELLEKYSTP